MQPRETTTFWLGIFISHRIIVLGQGSLDLARLPVLAGCGSLNNLECAACARRTHRTSSETQSAQLRRLERAQARPRGLGIPERAWTADRVWELIEYRTGMRHHEDHVWRILRKLGWTCQRLTGWALERDEEAIQQRKED